MHYSTNKKVFEIVGITWHIMVFVILSEINALYSITTLQN